jgi:hypothetical protein
MLYGYSFPAYLYYLVTGFTVRQGQGCDPLVADAPESDTYKVAAFLEN